jgi:hypothetical protein
LGGVTSSLFRLKILLKLPQICVEPGSGCPEILLPALPLFIGAGFYPSFAHLGKNALEAF